MSDGDVIVCGSFLSASSFTVRMANKPVVEELPTPSDKLLVTPVTSPTEDEKVKMKKQLGLLEGCAIIVGIICGSGIT